MLMRYRNICVKNNGRFNQIKLQQFADNARKQLLPKIHVIQETKECSRITEKINSEEDLIAVDLEATLGPPGLVQIAIQSGEIFLFRSGVNKSLFKEGGLKTVFENPRITKIFHDATGDNLSLGKAGIKMKSLFDTSIAHSLLRYQSLGQPLYGNLISFNNLCEEFSLEVNPFKSKYKGFRWMFAEKAFFSNKDLDEDLQMYAAYDVKPLIQLYNILKDTLEPDYQQIFHEMSQIVLDRPFDEESAKKTLKKLKNMEKNSVFLSGLKKSVNNPKLAEILEDYEKVVKMAPKYKAAHVTFESRQIALDVCSYFQTENRLSTLGKKCKIDLIRPEISIPAGPAQKSEDIQSHEKVDVEMAAPEIARKLLKAKCPVFVYFSTNVELQSPDVEFYVGQETKLKFNLSDASLVKSYGPLLSSPDVVKILHRCDVIESRQGLKIFHDEGFNAENLFDLALAVKVCNFIFHGISFCSSNSLTTKLACQKYGIKSENKWKDALHLHLHLAGIMPGKIRPLLDSLIQIGANFENVREDKKSLKARYESFNLHIKLDKSERCKNIEEILTNNGISYEVVLQMENSLILKICKANDFNKARELLDNKLQKRCIVRTIDTGENTEIGDSEICDWNELEKLRQKNQKRLLKLFAFLGENTEL